MAWSLRTKPKVVIMVRKMALLVAVIALKIAQVSAKCTKTIDSAHLHFSFERKVCF